MIALLIALSIGVSGPADAGCYEATVRGNVGPTVFYCKDVGQAGLLASNGELVADVS